jgi:hypothetical protein
VAAADFYQQQHEVTSQRLDALVAVTTELENCYERWLELSE